MFETPSALRFQEGNRKKSGGFQGLNEPLLTSSSSRSSLAGAPAWWIAWAMLPVAVAQLLLGAGEKVLFARMAGATPNGALVVHTVLTLLNVLLYALLRLARAQSSAGQVPAQLRRLRPARLAAMGVLDALHSLLLIDSAASLRGITQAVLAQASLPFTVGFACIAWAHTAQLLDARYSQPVGGTSEALVSMELLKAPLKLEEYGELPGPDEAGIARAGSGVATICDPHCHPSPPARDYQRDRDYQREPASHSDAEDARVIYVVAVGVSVCSSTLKLASAPVDLLVLNSWLPLAQSAAGLLLGPLLLQALHGRPVAETLAHLGRSLGCLLSSLAQAMFDGPDKLDWGHSDRHDRPSDYYHPATVPAPVAATVGEAQLARGEDERWTCSAEVSRVLPLLLLFFITSSLWGGLSLLLLRWGPPSLLHAASVLLLPLTVLLFVRPGVGRYGSWFLAPPEPLGMQEAAAGAALVVALLVYHSGQILHGSEEGGDQGGGGSGGASPDEEEPHAAAAAEVPSLHPSAASYRSCTTASNSTSDATTTAASQQQTPLQPRPPALAPSDEPVPPLEQQPEVPPPPPAFVPAAAPVAGGYSPEPESPPSPLDRQLQMAPKPVAAGHAAYAAPFPSRVASDGLAEGLERDCSPTPGASSPRSPVRAGVAVPGAGPAALSPGGADSESIFSLSFPGGRGSPPDDE
ncbi:hypothetical protein EMIHUDRAFT_222218 [Emiliania huxleyi CCMP1516]|uniref:Uncharacterized protein n=2 Tax=Emiliania huxleyi TaxID=2903 RepID=A0A0D3KYL7_EMIH1|nr:hypothetical protein EMIHUDRAFT_222218 [Emiliania huxleyi CCMP1516]EOD40852.1 hypothetical protein EMIHUDRAFT_222218 [Emiliania huxleyi CCMP1516]|eukprot:XP_005793281.1 hypothetical protein EMIHUDRAFT_222218 [Emiliania huxleyi CCMP1516]